MTDHHKKPEHERIWLEPEPGSDPDGGRMWAANDVWGDGTEYVLASEAADEIKRLTHDRDMLAQHIAPHWSDAERSSHTPEQIIDAGMQLQQAYTTSEIERLIRERKGWMNAATSLLARVQELEPQQGDATAIKQALAAVAMHHEERVRQIRIAPENYVAAKMKTAARKSSDTHEAIAAAFREVLKALAVRHDVVSAMQHTLVECGIIAGPDFAEAVTKHPRLAEMVQAQTEKRDV